MDVLYWCLFFKLSTCALCEKTVSSKPRTQTPARSVAIRLSLPALLSSTHTPYLECSRRHLEKVSREGNSEKKPNQRKEPFIFKRYIIIS